MIKDVSQIAFLSTQGRQWNDGAPTLMGETLISIHCLTLVTDEMVVRCFPVVRVDRKPCNELSEQLKAEILPGLAGSGTPLECLARIQLVLDRFRNTLQEKPFTLRQRLALSETTDEMVFRQLSSVTLR